AASNASPKSARSTDGIYFAQEDLPAMFQRILIANRGARALARGNANICAQRMLRVHQIALRVQRAGR
ncbi:MAG TPA: hypothetical protein VKP68_00010, partial [Ramlibacter sp.]|nr:hypothetical protein [Ramlibacter sp.]